LKIAEGVHTSDGFRPFVKLDTYGNALRAEAESWVTPDTSVEDKLLRERVRHPGMIRALQLHTLPTHRFDVLEVGGGPQPMSDLLPHRFRVVVDPCADAYRKIAPCPDHITMPIETYTLDEPGFDLVIATNSLDHVEAVQVALERMDDALRHGGYMAILCAENNALTHPHPSHLINLTVADIHRQLDDKYETVHELTYARDGFRYGWRRFDGACGQPAFAWLGRKAYP
jgi:SAM-dependent methyltransferase